MSRIQRRQECTGETSKKIKLESCKGFLPHKLPSHFILFIYFRSKLHPTHSQLFFQSNSSLTLHLLQEHHFHSSGHSMSRGSCTPNLQLNVIGKWYKCTCPMGQLLASKHVAIMFMMKRFLHCSKLIFQMPHQCRCSIDD